MAAADHPRTVIRTLFEIALQGVTSIGGRVYTGRVHPLPDDALTCALLDTPGEVTRDDLATMGGVEVRELTVQVKVVLQAQVGQDIYTDLDRAAADIEQAIFSDATIGATIIDLQLQRSDLDLRGEGDQPQASVTQEWSAFYQVDRADVLTIVN